jgi:AbrB family looped-hinge helix DNA binding protein
MCRRIVTRSAPLEVTIDKRGRVTIPKAVRDAYGFLPGAPIEIIETATGIELRLPVPRPAQLVRKGQFLVAVGDGRKITDKEIRDLRLADQR